MPADTSRIFGIVLAAGRSSRIGSPKALAELEGKTFAARAVQVLRAGGCEEVCVVVGPPHAGAVEVALSGVQVAHNPDPDRGMLSSLQVGLGSLLERHGMPGAVLFSLVDHPRVRSETVSALIALFERSRCRALRPVYAGRGGHPVLLSAAAVRELMASPATASVRDVLALGGGVEDLVVDDAGVVDDVDAVGDLEAIGASPRRE